MYENSASYVVSIQSLHKQTIISNKIICVHIRNDYELFLPPKVILLVTIRFFVELQTKE